VTPYQFLSTQVPYATGRSLHSPTPHSRRRKTPAESTARRRERQLSTRRHLPKKKKPDLRMRPGLGCMTANALSHRATRHWRDTVIPAEAGIHKPW
jgi:hypothetical protein